MRPFRFRPVLLWIWAFTLSGFVQTIYPIDLIYSGLNDSVEETLEHEPAIKELQNEKNSKTPTFQNKFELADGAITKVLHYYGFYNATVDPQITTKQVIFTINTGKPLKIGKIHFTARTEEGLKRLKQNFVLQRDQRFSHPRYQKAKTGTLRSFLKQGYLKARFLKSRVIILPGNQIADIRLDLNEGQRYRFGSLEVVGLTDYPDDFYRQWKTFKTGEYFSQAKLLKFYRAVQESGLFENVSIEADPGTAKGTQVPVVLSVKPYPPYSVTAAIGYATDFGPRLRLNLKRYNVFGSGHLFSSDIVVDTRQQFLKSNYVIPVTDLANRFYTVFTTLQNRQLPDDEQRLANFGFGYSATFDKKGEYNASAAYNFEQFTDAAQNRTFSKYFNVKSREIWLSLDDNIDPSQGMKFEISGEAVAEPLLSDFSALRLETNGTGYAAFLDQFIRTKSRVQLGYLLASKEPINLPNSLRFFAGGDRSVRGYGYQVLAPRSPLTGEIVGGKAILTTSVEVEFKLYKKFGWVTYSDFGGASDDFSFDSFGLSVGTGLRWHSPVGPMGLSVAFPLRNTSEAFRLVVTIGSL